MLKIDEEIAAAIENGMSNKEIMERLDIAQSTLRRAKMRIREEGIPVPNKHSGYVANNGFEEMRRGLASIQTEKPEAFLKRLAQFPKYQDIKIRK